MRISLFLITTLFYGWMHASETIPDIGTLPVNNDKPFSTPNAAIYALNDGRPRAFPALNDTGFSGNGHAETWDGRLFVVTRTAGWFAAAFRPERIVRNENGTVSFRQGAFGRTLALELKTDAPDMQHNWIALVPDPAVDGQNPYPSNADGTFNRNGTFDTYKALVYHTSLRNNDNDQMGIRRATFIVENARTRDAQVVRAEFTSPFQRLRLQNGEDFRCIEPTVTLDGRLIIGQGHPDNNGRIDNLVYGWNPTPGATENWRGPFSLAGMYFNDRDTLVDGIPFHVRYPIAENPLRDATGVDYQARELIKGAYPWISHDGTELFYQASRDGVSARRTGTSVVGRWTGWTVRHIDGPINPNRHADTRLFLSSPGAFTTMWTPFKDQVDLALPYSVRGPSYPIFGSNSRNYAEIGFDDYLDGNFVLYLGMNEQLNRAGNFQVTRSNDTSGNFNNATLVGARFPLEYNGRDELVGRYGQAIYFDNGDYLDVARNRGWDSLRQTFSVDFWLNLRRAGGTVRLFHLQGGIEIYLTNGTRLAAAVTDEAGNRRVLNGVNVPTNVWRHLALTFDGDQNVMRLYVDGAEVASRAVSALGAVATAGAVRIGPENATALMLLDEVKVSNVARQPYEIAYYANAANHRAPSQALVDEVPEHLQPALQQATDVARFSLEAAALGADLFEDVILSRNRTTSCATCHDPSLAFTDGLAIAAGNEPTDAGTRNTPTLLNRLFSSFQGWSGNADSLDTQALVPIAAPHEMNLPISTAVQRLSAEGGYAARFQHVFGEAPNATNLPIALASFQALQFSERTRVDDYRAGDRDALSAAEQRGLVLFEGKARCSGCHAGPLYSDESFRNNGLTASGDIGRADTTGRERDSGLFKVPTLRELGQTAPYMHDGNMASLRDVVQAYNDGAPNGVGRDSDIRPLELNAGEINDLVAFLGALSVNGIDDGPDNSPQVDEVTLVAGVLVGGAGSAQPGFTLYVFDDDLGGSGSRCENACSESWPPVLVEDLGASGVAGLATIRRNDGTRQAAFNGRPLYFFRGDQQPGETRGNGINERWWTAQVDGGGDGGDGADGGDGGDPATVTNSLRRGDRLTPGDYLRSRNSAYRLNFQGDGNLVLREVATSQALWSSGTHGQDAARLVLQSDGNLVLYANSGAALWASGSNGSDADRAVLNSDGSFVIYAGNRAVWSVNGTGVPDDPGNGGDDDSGNGGDDDPGNGGDDDPGNGGDDDPGNDDTDVSNGLAMGDSLMIDNHLASQNGAYRLYFQGDGNLVLRDQATRQALWSTKTGGRGGVRLRLQSDGNLVMRDSGGTPLWSSGTHGMGADRVILGNDGSLVIYAGNRPVWRGGDEDTDDPGADEIPDDGTAPAHVMAAGDTLRINEFLISSNGAYRLTLQSDGNLVLRDRATRQALWSTKSGNQGGERFTLQADGNLVLYSSAGPALWSSKTHGSGADRAVLENDGALVVYAGNRVVWTVNRAGKM